MPPPRLLNPTDPAVTVRNAGAEPPSLTRGTAMPARARPSARHRAERAKRAGLTNLGRVREDRSSSVMSRVRVAPDQS